MSEEQQGQETMFTEEQVNEQIEKAKRDWIEKELNPIVAERDELAKYKPKEKTEAEKAIEAREKELFQKEVNIELKSAGLEQFADFFNVQDIEELKGKIEKFQGILNEMKLDNSYQPTDHKHTDEYSNAKSKGDTLGMIKSLFGANN